MANKGKTVLSELFSYWIIVILWQTFRPVPNRSLIDVAVKAICMASLILYGARKNDSNSDSKFNFLFTFFILTQILTLLFDISSISLGIVITVGFMIIQVVVFFVWLNYDYSSEIDLEGFAKKIVLVAVIMAVYNMFSQWGRFVTVLTSGGGSYGYECSSFLYSNHEFGVYLATGIVLLLWLKLRNKINFMLFIIIELCLSVNLLSTYSRTAIIACVVSIYILLFFYSKGKFIAWALIGSVAVIIIFATPTLRAILFEKILKGSFIGGQVFDTGRESMYENSWEMFISSGFFRKLIGKGHSQLGGHDAYLAILNCGGICMFVCFLSVIVYGIKNSFEIIRYDRSVGSLMFGFQIFSLLDMVAQTPIFFYSTMDSFFITMIAILIPKYICNYYKYGDQSQLVSDYESMSD